jgi:serine/threonine-protein kinase
MTREGVVKLADMGLARLAADEQAAQAEAGRAFGTPYYISPEQIRGELNIDFRADIYSLGATLYHLVTGQVPFDATTPAAVMHRHLKDHLVPPDHLNTSLSAGLGEVVEKMMAKRPQDRYASTRDLIQDLELVAAGQVPLQARKAISAKALSALAHAQVEEEEPPAQAPASELSISHILFYLLLTILGLSVLANILQAVWH